MSKFGLILVIPHSGTHRLLSFITQLHTQAKHVSIGECGNGILEAYLKGQIDYQTFTSCLKWMRMKYPDPPYKERDMVEAIFNEGEVSLEARGFDSKYKWLFLYSHMLEDNHQGHLWPEDIIRKGRDQFQILSCLRDPILVTTSLALSTGDHAIDYADYRPPCFKGVTPYVWWTLEQFERLVEYRRRFGRGILFLPVDLYNQISDEDRILRATNLISQLGLKARKDWTDSVLAWDRFNPNHGRDDMFNNQAALADYKLIRRELDLGHDLPVSTPLIDYLIERYRNMDGLQELFESEGYKNLCWFK